MNILVLHGIADPKKTVKNVADIELSLPKYAKGHNFIFHNYHLPFPESLKENIYDGVIMWSTFLCARFAFNTYNFVRTELSFIKDLDAVKIALAQDDYYCNELLDQWMCDWEVDYLYTIAHESQEYLFPKFAKSPGQLRKAFTGYVTQELLKRSAKLRNFDERSIDVSYRASGTPTNLNRIAIIKAQIGEIFESKLQTEGLILDISTKRQDFIYGDKWFDFLNNTRFSLGVNSGSSINVPTLEVTEEIEQFRKNNPNADYDEIVNRFLKEQDKKVNYTMVSPRNIECGLFGCCQITTNLGPYNGLMEPNVHFIPIEPDCSNIEDVVRKMRDNELVHGLINTCRESFLSLKKLRIESLFEELIFSIKNDSPDVSKDRLRYKKYQLLYSKHLLEYNYNPNRVWLRTKKFIKFKILDHT